MNVDPDFAETRPAVLMAAALHLLSCSAAHGITEAKSASLVQHLSELAERSGVDPVLARACEELASVWQRLGEEAHQAREQEAQQRRAQLATPSTLH